MKHSNNRDYINISLFVNIFCRSREVVELLMSKGVEIPQDRQKSIKKENDQLFTDSKLMEKVFSICCT